MTKKDFEFIAKILSQWLDNGDNRDLDGIIAGDLIAHKFAIALEKKYPRFQKDRFLKACGLYEF